MVVMLTASRKPKLQAQAAPTTKGIAVPNPTARKATRPARHACATSTSKAVEATAKSRIIAPPSRTRPEKGTTSASPLWPWLSSPPP